jgi:tRNA G18 (ribose-2'-O)-methylase SpoU
MDGGSSLSLILLMDDGASPEALQLAARAMDRGIPVRRETERELRRMSSSDIAEEVIALAGPSPMQTLDQLMRGEGIVFILTRLRYPGNVGYILRCLEVAGGAGVVLDSDWGSAQREEAFRVGMRANRFFPVLEAKAEDAVAAARSAGRRVIAVETSGDASPWEVDLAGPTVVLVGSETTGIPTPLLDAADAVVSIPVDGFIPSYNVQAAVGIFLGEWMRQNDPLDRRRPTPSGR